MTTAADRKCSKCGGEMEAGITNAIGLIAGSETPGKPRLTFIVPGEPTSLNPVKAINQGLQDRPADRVFLIHGYRCSHCAALELYTGQGHERIPEARLRQG